MKQLRNIDFAIGSICIIGAFITGMNIAAISELDRINKEQQKEIDKLEIKITESERETRKLLAK